MLGQDAVAAGGSGTTTTSSGTSTSKSNDNSNSNNSNRGGGGGSDGDECEGMLPHTQVHLRVRPEMTVQELKHAIESCAQIPAENQILIFRGNRLLNPDETLQQAGVGPASIMHLVLQLRRPQATVTRGAALLRDISSRLLSDLAQHQQSPQAPPPPPPSDPPRTEGTAAAAAAARVKVQPSSNSSSSSAGSAPQRGPQL